VGTTIPRNRLGPLQTPGTPGLASPASPASRPGVAGVADVSDVADAAEVDIVVPVFNESGGLAASIRGLHADLARRFPLTWTITIADNASTDRTWDIARGLAG